MRACELFEMRVSHGQYYHMVLREAIDSNGRRCIVLIKIAASRNGGLFLKYADHLNIDMIEKCMQHLKVIG